MAKAESDHSKKFTEKAFWKKFDKLVKYGKEAGRTTICKVLKVALILYYCLRDPDTPLRVKPAIPAPLGYFIWPFDAIPDPIPAAGYVDDWGVLLATLALIAVHIKKEHIQKAEERLPMWCDG